MIAAPSTPPELKHFASLDRDAQAAAIRRLAQQGLSDYDIASATRLAVEQVRSIVGQRPSCAK